MNQTNEPFLLNEIRGIFRDVFEEPGMNIDADTSKQDLPQWDSDAQVKLIMLVEETFGIELDSDEVGPINTAGDFVKAVQSRRV